MLGRKITHNSVSQEELATEFKTRGLPHEISDLLAGADVSISKGSEEIMNDVVEKVTGKKPLSFREFAERYKSVWQQ